MLHMPTYDICKSRCECSSNRCWRHGKKGSEIKIKNKEKFNGCFKSIVLGNSFRTFLWEKNFFFFFWSLTTFYIFHKSDINFFFFFKLSIDKFCSINQTKKNEMEQELRIRKEKRDGRFGHEDQSVSNNKRKWNPVWLTLRPYAHLARKPPLL